MFWHESLLDAAVSTATPLIITQTTQVVSQLIGLAVLAGTLAALAALTYRWYTRETIPEMLALLVGLSGVALYLNTTTALGQAVVGDLELVQDFQLALYHLAAFLSGTAGALGGRRVGDRFGTDVLLEGTATAVDEEVSRLVQTVGRVIVVELPEEIDDVVGYDPVPEATRETLSGRRFVFPRNLTVEQLHSRLVARLKTDYAVGHVDIELTDDGTVEYLAVGSRAAGIGPTLPPATNAVAIRADPAFAASSGDLVQVWETDPMRRVVTAELRGVADDVVTIAIDSADTPKLDPTRQYRLVTLSVDDRPAREFASLLRAADETFSSVTVEAGSPLHGLPVGALSLTVLAVTPASGQQVVLPDGGYVLAPGETVFAIARPERLRRLERAAEPLDQTLVGAATRGVDPDTPSAGEREDAASAGQGSAIHEKDEFASPDVPVEPAENDLSELGFGDDNEKAWFSAGDVDRAREGDESSEDNGDNESGEDDEDNGDNESGEDDENNRDDGNGEGDGASTFAQLKEEFESGEADWADDVSDDPTGDIRFDE